MNIDNNLKTELNKQFCRKRIININYLIKQILKEMGSEKSKLVRLKISSKTLENYNKWWDNYNKLRN